MPFQAPCPDDCTCGKHVGRNGSRPCPPGCACSKHHRTREHNDRIGMSVRLTAEAKRREQ